MNQKRLLVALLSGLLVSGTAQASSNSQMALGGMFVSAFDTSILYALSNTPYQIDPKNPVLEAGNYQGKYKYNELTPFNYGASNMWSAIVLSGITSTLLAPWELDFNAAMYFNPFTTQGVLGSGDISLKNYRWGTFKLGYRGNEAPGNVSVSVAYTGAKFTAVENALNGGDWSWNYPGFSWLSPRWKGFTLALSAGVDSPKLYSNKKGSWIDNFNDTYSTSSFPNQYGSALGVGLKWGNRRDDISFAFSYTQANAVKDPSGFFPASKTKRIYSASAFYALESGNEDQVGLSLEATYGQNYGMKSSATEEVLRNLNYQSELDGVRVSKSALSADSILLAPANDYHHIGADVGLAWTHGRHLMSFVTGWDTFKVQQYPGFHIPAWENNLVNKMQIQKGTLKDTNLGAVFVPSPGLENGIFGQFNKIYNGYIQYGMDPFDSVSCPGCADTLPKPWPRDYPGLTKQTDAMQKSYGTLRTYSVYLGMNWVYFWSSSLHFTFKINGAYTKLKMHYDYGDVDRDLGYGYTADMQAGFRILF